MRMEGGTVTHIECGPSGGGAAAVPYHDNTWRRVEGYLFRASREREVRRALALAPLFCAHVCRDRDEPLSLFPLQLPTSRSPN